jgi:hypothetical protein
MKAFFKVTFFPKMNEKDKLETEQDDVTLVDQEKVFWAYA